MRTVIAFLLVAICGAGCAKKNISSTQSYAPEVKSENTIVENPKLEIKAGERLEAVPVKINWDEEKLQNASEQLKQNQTVAEPTALPSKAETKPVDVKKVRFKNSIPPK